MASIDELRLERLKKLEILTKKGINPYPVLCDRDLSIADTLEDFSRLSKRRRTLAIAGRVMAKREHGGSVFLDCDDGTGAMQAYIKKDNIGNEAYELFKNTIDVGDFISVRGKLFSTKRREKTIEAHSWQMLAKSLRPLPDKWHGISNVEEKFRKRYLDILMSPDVLERFKIRARMLQELRALLDKDSFIEVETPMLQHQAGGAAALPFKTHHNALDMDLYLRIAPELYLKELLIGGMSRVYEIGRSFRNEGIDVTHNPEFTSIEAYAAYSTPEEEQKRIEKIIKSLARKILGKKELVYGEHAVSIGATFKKISCASVLKRFALIGEKEFDDKDALRQKAQQFGIPVREHESAEKILDNIFKKVCRPKIIEPTFITDYPIHSAPLAKKKEGSATLIDRFQLVIAGMELANGFAELNDPIDQKERFIVQEKNRASGDGEAHVKDDAFLEALEYGMPPATGWGIGIDRLIMFFTNSPNIRDIIIFPILRPK